MTTQTAETDDHPLTRAFADLAARHRGRAVTVQEIQASLGTEGAPAFIILLALPFCLPVTIPGFSVPFGLSIAYLSRAMMRGEMARLPRRIAAHEISAKHFERLMAFTIRWWGRIERVIHHRLPGVGDAPWLRRLSGWLIILNGLVLCLPVPIPLSNTIPALAIVALSLGAIERDGVCALAGMVLSLLGVLYITAVLVLGKLALLRFLGVV